MMVKLGIFLAYAPEQSLSEHGLGRLLGMLLQGMSKRDVSLVLAMPHWCVDEVREVLDDFDVDTSRIEWLTTPRDPVLLRMRRFFMHWRRRRRGRRAGFFRTAARTLVLLVRYIGNAFASGLSTSSLWMFGITLVVLLVPPIALALLLARNSPLALAALVVLMLVAMLLWRSHRLRTAVSARLSRLRGGLSALFRPAREFRQNTFAQRLYSRMREQEMNRLLSRINRRHDIEAWLVPTLFWPEAARIVAPKTVVVPDLVMIDAPVHFAKHATLNAFENLRRSVACADRLICYSEHVKATHLCRRFGIDSAHVSVIEHAPVDTRVPFLKPLYNSLGMPEAAALMLREFLADGAGERQLRGVDLTEAPFVFYASQVRPHKNILTLIKAHEMLLRRELVDVKLVLTGDLFAPEAQALADYVQRRRLQYDVISLPRVPARILSALFALARLAVCPTLFEGGLPFTFTEALAVGTPVIMSRIPVVEEKITDAALASMMLFDPYDERDLCERMHWALANRAKLLSMQRVLHARFATRTWDDVAADYLEVMRSAIRTEPVA